MELRGLKMAAHKAFDPLWSSGKMSRAKAYKWLGKRLNLTPENTHIGMFDEQMCREVIKVCGDTAHL